MDLNPINTRWLSAWRSKSYDVLPALSVRGPVLRSSLRLVTIAWMFGSVWMFSINGATIGSFAKLVGFTDMDWGIWTAIPYAAMLAQLPASYLIENTGLRKFTFLHTTTLHRLLWIPVGLIPLALLLFPSISSQWMVWMLFAIVFLSGVLGNIGAPAWTTWMSDLIPTRIRGRYFAVRNAICVTVQMITTLSLGVILSGVIRSGAPLTVADQPWLVVTMVAVFLIAGITGATDILLFRRIRDVVPPTPPRRMTFRQIMIEPMRNRRFVRFVLGWTTLTFGTAISTAYFLPLCQDYYHMNPAIVNFVLIVCGTFGGIISSKFWGRLCDRWGRRPVLIVGTAGSVLAVWMWLLIPPISPMFSLIVCGLCVLIGGVIWTGVGIAQFNIILGFSNEQGRSSYVAAFNGMSSIGGVIAGLLGGKLALWFGAFHWQVGPMIFINYHVLFFISGLIRIGSLFLLAGMQEPGARPARQMVRSVVGSYGTVAARLFRSPRA